MFGRRKPKRRDSKETTGNKSELSREQTIQLYQEYQDSPGNVVRRAIEVYGGRYGELTYDFFCRPDVPYFPARDMKDILTGYLCRAAFMDYPRYFGDTPRSWERLLEFFDRVTGQQLDEFWNRPQELLDLLYGGRVRRGPMPLA